MGSKSSRAGCKNCEKNCNCKCSNRGQKSHNRVNVNKSSNNRGGVGKRDVGFGGCEASFSGGFDAGGIGGGDGGGACGDGGGCAFWVN